MNGNNNEYNNQKPNYNDSQYNKDYYSNSGQNYQQSDYVPQSYGMSSRYDDLYDYEEESGSGSFIAGALVGAVIGAAAALFLAPKSGKEFRGDLNNQVTTLKEKSQSSKSDSDNEGGGLKQQLKDQSSKVVDKVKGMKGGSSPMDDGTASSEGEESIDMQATIENTVHESNKETEAAGNEAFTSTANALKEAVEEVNEDKKSGSGYATGSTAKDAGNSKNGSNKNQNTGSGSNSKQNNVGSYNANKNNSGNNNSNKNNSNSNSNKNNSTK